MRKQLLGQTDIVVSALGLGSVKFGRNTGVKYPWKFNLPTDKEIINLLALAQDLGINVLDTAPAYGESEQRLGKLLTQRENWVLMSKVGECFVDDQSSFNYSKQFTIKSIHQSLQKLGTDYLDIVFVHSDGNDLAIIENEAVFTALEELKSQGIIRALGLSGKTTAGGLWAIEHCDVVMATRNQHSHQDDAVLDKAKILNKGIVIKKGLESGHVDPKAGGIGVEQAMEYVFSHPAVNSLIVGTINPEHLRENVTIVNRLTETIR